MLRKTVALVLSAHPIPALAVTAIALILGLGIGLPPDRLVALVVATALNQASIGLSNDWIDAERDRAASRADKPVALSKISANAVRNAAFVCLLGAIAVSIALGPPAMLVHAVAVGSAWAYNAGLKSTWVSPLPYIVSFGLLPGIAYLASEPPVLPPAGVVIAGGLLGLAAHFANVLPDIEDDLATGVRGLPHRLGRRASGLVIAGSLEAASLILAFASGAPVTVVHVVVVAVVTFLAVACVVVVFTRPRSALSFRFIMVGALLDVILLAATPWLE